MQMKNVEAEAPYRRALALALACIESVQAHGPVAVTEAGVLEAVAA